jgi:NADH:ubiquinone oxidoreductase subunit E
MKEAACLKIDDIETKEKLKKLDEYIKNVTKLNDNQGLLMGVLHKTQELFGYLPTEVMDYISDKLKVPTAHIYGMSTFYNYFTLKPRAKYQIFMCKGTACYVGGGARVLEKLQSALGLEVGDVTPDKMFGLGITRCLGCCGLSPVMQVNEDIYVRMVPEKINGILDKYRKPAKKKK